MPSPPSEPGRSPLFPLSLLSPVVLVCGAVLVSLLSSGPGWGSSRNHHYYPSTTPQFASQLEIEVVSLLFRNNNILASDTRHDVIFMNISGIDETVPQKNGESGTFVTVASGQAVVVGGNTHTAPVPAPFPQAALDVGIDPLSIAEVDNLAYIADGSGRIEALNLSHHVRELIVIPTSKVRLNAGDHVSKLLKRSPTIGKLLGMATTLPIGPGEIAAIAGGGTIAPDITPIDALKARMSPMAITADGTDLYIGGEAGHIYYLNNGPAPQMLPLREGSSTVYVKVRPGQMLLIASRGGNEDPYPGSDPVSALGSTLNPATMVATDHRLFVGDQGGEIVEINLSDKPIPLTRKNGGETLRPGRAISLSGGGTLVVASTRPIAATDAILRPRSMAYDKEGILFVGDIEETLQAGRVLALNVTDHPINLPFMRHGHFRKISLGPGQIVAIAGNSRRQPVARTTPDPAGDIGIEPVQLSFRNGLLVVGDLLGSIDLVNMTFHNRRVFPRDVQKTLLLPPGKAISLMGSGTGSSEKPGDEVH